MAGREKFPQESPRAGDLVPPYPLGEIAQIKEVDPVHYIIKVAVPMTRSGLIQNALILKRSPGDYELPRPGDVGFFQYDSKKNAICVGYVEIDFPTKVENTQIPSVKPGQKFSFSRGLDANGNPENTFMATQSEGEYKIQDQLGNGMEISEGLSVHTNDTEILDTAGGDLRVGNVRRAIPPTQPEAPVVGPTGVFKEFLLRLYDKVTTIWKAEIRMGDVLSDLGLPVPGPFGAPLRGLINIFNSLGIKVSSVQMDEAGNMVLTAQLQAVLKAKKVSLGSEASMQPYLLSIPWITYFLTHTHTSSAPGTPTSPVMVPPNPNEIFSKKVFGE